MIRIFAAILSLASAGSKEASTLLFNWLEVDHGWGADRASLINAAKLYTFSRHVEVQRMMCWFADCFACQPL